MPRLTEQAVAMGKQGAKKKWEGVSDAERKKIMELVRRAKKERPKASDSWALANAVFQRQNQRSRGGR